MLYALAECPIPEAGRTSDNVIPDYPNPLQWTTPQTKNFPTSQYASPNAPFPPIDTPPLTPPRENHLAPGSSTTQVDIKCKH